MKIVKKILSWVFIIALILPNIILLKYFVDSAFQPTRDMYAIPITIMLCALILLKTIELLPKFKAPKKKLKITSYQYRTVMIMISSGILLRTSINLIQILSD